VDTSDLKLDGNAIAGTMRELFGIEMTVAPCVCRSCGAREVMACVDVYVNAPGTVVRCRHCQSVLMTIVRGRDRTWLDPSGLRLVELPS